MRLVLNTILGALVVLLATAGPSAAGEPPNSIVIDSLSELYSGVTFDHAMHVDIAGSCGVCHHHTTGGEAEPQCASCHQGQKSSVVACQACHPAQPFSAEYLREKEQDRGRYHLDKPGLKAAYHRNCLGCHEESGGPTGCEECHALTDAGEALYRTGSHAPEPQSEETTH